MIEICRGLAIVWPGVSRVGRVGASTAGLRIERNRWLSLGLRISRGVERTWWRIEKKLVPCGQTRIGSWLPSKFRDAVAGAAWPSGLLRQCG